MIDRHFLAAIALCSCAQLSVPTDGGMNGLADAGPGEGIEPALSLASGAFTANQQTLVQRWAPQGQPLLADTRDDTAVTQTTLPPSAEAKLEVDFGPVTGPQAAHVVGVEVVMAGLTDPITARLDLVTADLTTATLAGPSNVEAAAETRLRWSVNLGPEPVTLRLVFTSNSRFSLATLRLDTTRSWYPFCPRKLDVFGYSNVFFQGCGGAGVPAQQLASGGVGPGAQWAATLAGRLEARVLATPRLTARFGSEGWRVRNCASGGGTLDTFVPASSCGGQRAGTYQTMCTDDPAPLALFSANGVNDSCHGGEVENGVLTGDKPGFEQLYGQQLSMFVSARAAKVMLISPQHEWHAAQGTDRTVPAANNPGCLWARPEWNRTAFAAWLQSAGRPTGTDVFDVGNLQDTFKKHHPCCSVLGTGECLADWFVNTDWVHFRCEGATALEEMWWAKLEEFLLGNSFACP